jgi:hypothetical protein
MKLPDLTQPLTAQARLVVALIGVGLALVALFYLAAWPRITTWYYHRQDTKHVAQRDQARAEVKVARQDEAQVTRSAEISTATTTAQDAHASAQRAATTQDVEAIHERIRADPAPALPPDDRLVRLVVDQARARAQAAADRVRGTPPD